RPIIGITMGDAAGIGPEIIVKALLSQSMYEACKPLVIGDAKILERASKIIGTDLRIHRLKEVSEARFEYGTIDCIDLNLLPADLPFGVISGEAGNGAYQFIKKAIELAQNKEIHAICTAPLNKEALHNGGHVYPGHTEIFA